MNDHERCKSHEISGELSVSEDNTFNEKYPPDNRRIISWMQGYGNIPSALQGKQ